MNERNVRARDVCLGSTGGKTNTNFNRLLLPVTWVILTIIFCVCIEKIFRVGVVNPSLLRVEEAAAGRLSSQCFSWESRQRGAHLHLYYLWEFEHHNEKCVKDWRLSGSHTHTRCSLKCKLLLRRVAAHFNDFTPLWRSIVWRNRRFPVKCLHQ